MTTRFNALDHPKVSNQRMKTWPVCCNPESYLWAPESLCIGLLSLSGQIPCE